MRRLQSQRCCRLLLLLLFLEATPALAAIMAAVARVYPAVCKAAAHGTLGALRLRHPPLLHQHLDSADARLRRSAVRVMGVVAEHGGKLLSRKAEAEVASKLVAALQASDARYSTNIAASEAAEMIIRVDDIVKCAPRQRQ